MYYLTDTTSPGDIMKHLFYDSGRENGLNLYFPQELWLYHLF
jgi:hypothetical protein